MIKLKRREFKVLCAQHDIPSDRQFCLRAGINNMSFSRWQNGHTAPNLRMIDTICEVLNCQPGDILRWERDPS